MSFRFRLAEPDDLPACLALLRDEGGHRAAPHEWDALPLHWRALLGAPAVRFVVWEHLASPPQRRLHSFAVSALVEPAFARELVASPAPWPASRLYARLGTREAPLLTERRIAAGNAGDGLDLVVLHNPLRHRALDDPMLQAVMPVGFAAFVFCHAGLHLRRVLWEVHGEAFAGLLAQGGYREASRYDGDPRVAGIPASLRPVLMTLDRDGAHGTAYDAPGVWLFRRNPPVIGLTRSERRLLERALLGASDREIATSLALSEHTVRHTWRTAVARAATALPGLYDVGPASGNGERGPAVRRALLEHVRHHMHELRPFETAPGRGGPRPTR